MKKITSQSSLPFQQLVLGACGLISFRWRSFVIGAISFALLSAVAATFADAKIDENETAIASAVGMTKEELQVHVTSELEALSESEFFVYIQHLQKDGFARAPVTKENLVIQFIIRTGPFAFGLMVFDLAVLFVCFVFFMSFFSNPIDTAYETSQKFPLAILKMGALSLWVFFRSLVWLPLIGPFVAVYYGPRFALSPAILSSGEVGLLRSSQLSLERTRGRWLSVFFRVLGILFIACACLWVSIVIAGSVGLFFLKAGFFLWLFGVMATIGFVSALMVVLGASYR